MCVTDDVEDDIQLMIVELLLLLLLLLFVLDEYSCIKLFVSVGWKIGFVKSEDNISKSVYKDWGYWTFCLGNAVIGNGGKGGGGLMSRPTGFFDTVRLCCWWCCCFCRCLAADVQVPIVELYEHKRREREREKKEERITATAATLIYNDIQWSLYV
jgi:hypothetical protein